MELNELKKSAKDDPTLSLEDLNVGPEVKNLGRYIPAVWSLRSFTLRFPEGTKPPTDQRTSNIGVMLLGLIWISACSREASILLLLCL